MPVYYRQLRICHGCRRLQCGYSLMDSSDTALQVYRCSHVDGTGEWNMPRNFAKKEIPGDCLRAMEYTVLCQET